MKVFRLFLFLLALALVIPAAANITSQTNRAGPYTCTVLPATVSVVFPFQQASDILVLNLGQSGTSIDPPTVLTLNSDYTVTGGGYNATTNMQSGNVVVNTGGAHNVQVNDQILILRNVPINQTTSFTSGVLTAAAIEKALDKQATLSQQGAEAISRSLRFEPGETRDGTLNRTARTGKVLGFDSNGNISYYAFSGGTVLPQSIQGTANQVLVNGTSGTPVTGSATLTLPQDVAITSTPQFQRMGIGQAPTATNDLVVSRLTPNVTAQASVLVNGNLTAPAATDLHPNAFRDTTGFTSTVAADAYASYDAQASLGGAQNYNHFYGFQARSGYSALGTVGTFAGFSSNLTVSAGTTTRLMNYYAQDAINPSGTITGLYGLYVDQLTKGTDRWAIYVAGNDKFFMGGGQIATSSDLAPINTNARVAVTFNQLTEYGIDIKNKSGLNTGYMLQFYNSSGVQQGSIQQVNSTTIVYNTTSDKRLKENIRDFPNSGALIDRMQPRVFDWKHGVKDAHGFIAQELYEVYPEAVSKGDDSVETPKPWAVDYSKLTPVLTAEVKDLRRRVGNLEVIVGFLALFVITQAGILAFRFNRKSS